jgi:hypothetical protein
MGGGIMLAATNPIGWGILAGSAVTYLGSILYELKKLTQQKRIELEKIKIPKIDSWSVEKLC